MKSLRSDNLRSESSDDENYKIVESQSPVLLFFGHNFLILISESGKCIGEMEGLAISKEGRTRSIGYWKLDRLKVYEFAHPHLCSQGQPRQVIYRGNQQDTMKRWEAARDAKKVINQLNLPYPFLGLGKNSNSVASTLIACMGLQELKIPGARWAPWKGCRVLPQSTIDEIKRRHGI